MDWSRSMAVSFAYYEVDPSTWRDLALLDAVMECRITRDLEMETLGQASFTIEGIEDGERWIRCYLDASQDGGTERICMGTFLVQTPRRSSNGMSTSLECTAYTSLHVLAEAKPNAGYALATGSNCIEAARGVCELHGLAPVVAPPSNAVLDEPYVAPSDASWLEIAKALAAAAGMRVGVDPFGRVAFEPDTPAYALAPAWTFRDDETSILLPDVSEEIDWYGLPNVCVVSTPSGIVGRAENADPMSRISTVSRGREVTLKIDDPDELRAGCTQDAADAYALRNLREASCMERVANVAYGYCPVNVGDLVRVEAPSLGIVMNALVARQDIEVSTALIVNAKLAVREEMWDGD